MLLVTITHSLLVASTTGQDFWKHRCGWLWVDFAWLGCCTYLSVHCMHKVVQWQSAKDTLAP